MSDVESFHGEDRLRTSRYGQWTITIAALFVAYIVSSGPIIAIGCWLRDATDWNGFYAVFVLYLPILYLVGDVDLFETYLMWWMKLLDARMPG